MKKSTIFTGAATAVITPMKNNEVDYAAFGKLLDWQIDSGIDAIVVCGTTGESSTLTDEEHREAIRFAVERTAKRVPLIAGTGSNDTAYALDLTRFACDCGADAVLAVTPYYNKTTQKGLVCMYEAIANISTVPVIVYNVPSRTGVNIEPSTYAMLSEVDNIAAIKEANSDISKITETMSLVGDKLDLYSGNDDQIVPLMALGAKGIISVMSNLIPYETHLICEEFFKGNIAKSAELQFKYMPLIKALFCQVNPIPIKAAMAAAGFCENDIRLPLVEMDEDKRQGLLTVMNGLGLINR